MNERVSNLPDPSSHHEEENSLDIRTAHDESIAVHSESAGEETEDEKASESSDREENDGNPLTPAGTTQDDDSDSMLVDAIPSLAEQRDLISKIYAEHQKEAKEGDKVYIIPSMWFDTFWNAEITNYTDIEPIDTVSICKDFENFVLADYNVSPYLSVPEEAYEKFVEWYGLTPNSKPVCTFLIKDTNDQLVTEYNRCFFRVHLLRNASEETRSYNANASPLFFTLSKLSSIRDVAQRCLEVFDAHEESFDLQRHKFRIWYFKDPGNSEESTSFTSRYKISPLVFTDISIKHRIVPKIFGCLIKDLRYSVIDLAVEYKEPNMGQHWASNYFSYHKLCPSKGIVGLSNLGNTCYMNSALQCLVHIPELRDYFLYNGYGAEINTNNPLGYGGRVAQAFAGLIQTLFGESISEITAYSPRNFKSVIGHYNSMFAGFLQQDSQEFMAFLLDGLHEDLNRILEKPYVEKPELSPGDDVNNFNVIKELAENTWDKHKMRNDSMIIDLFVGMYKSTLVCPQCNNISITFDPYNDLTLPLPVDNYWSSKIILFPSQSPPCLLEIELPKTASYKELKEYVASCANMKADDLLGAEIFNHQFYNNYEARNSDSQYLPVQDLISKDDFVAFYEVPRGENDLVVPVLNTRFEEGFKNSRLFGYPFFITLSNEEQHSYGTIRQKLEKCFVNLSGGFIDFPFLKSDDNVSIDSLPLLSQKYPGVDFTQFENDIRQCTPDQQPNRFFDIKVLTCKQPAGSNSNLHTSPESSFLRTEIWTPDSRAALNMAADITLSMNNVAKDIYNYYDLVKDQREEIEELGRLTDEKKRIASEVEESEEGEEIISDMDVDVEENTDDTKSVKALSNEEKLSESYPFQKLICAGSALICEWSSEGASQVFSEDREISWDNPGIITNTVLESSREEKNKMRESKILLEDCLNLFSKPEVLGAADSWYCPVCKEHRQATKQIELWNTPDILLIHLKRFENMRSFSDKINETVHFPITGLDMSPFLVYNDERSNNIYDLIAVDNHYGGLGGGHYTAYVENPADDGWYYFDDSRVSKTDPEKSISGAAYLLFYRRRTEKGDLGGENLTQIIRSSREQHDLKIKELNERQAQFYEDNKSESEDEAIKEDHKNSQCEKDLDEKEISSAPNDDKMHITRPSKDLDYSINSLEVGDHIKDSNTEENAARRKLRLLNKTYLNTPTNSSDVASTGGSSESSDESESISHNLNTSNVNPAPQSP